MRLPWLGRPQGSPLRRITIRPTIQVADKHLLCQNREAWQRSGEQSLWQRAVAEVEERLAAYPDSLIDSAVNSCTDSLSSYHLL